MNEKEIGTMEWQCIHENKALRKKRKKENLDGKINQVRIKGKAKKASTNKRKQSTV